MDDWIPPVLLLCLVATIVIAGIELWRGPPKCDGKRVTSTEWMLMPIPNAGIPMGPRMSMVPVTKTKCIEEKGKP